VTLTRPVFVSHVVPDADALGSMFAMTRAMSGKSCHATASLPDGSLSQRLRFMADWAGVNLASGEDFAGADGFVVLDTAKRPRCNIVPEIKAGDWSAGRPVFNIDHHGTNTNFGDFNWIVEAAGSTCEMVYALLRVADVEIDDITASLLFAGMLTDTSGFSLPTTTSIGLRTAGELAALGAKIGELGDRLCRSQSQSEFHLLKIIYANTNVLAGGRIAYSFAAYDEIMNAGCSAADIDDQVDIPRSVNGAVMAMLFTEGHRGKTRINFRGSGDVTVVELAREFGGGGHSHAAGAVLDGPVDEVIKTVLPIAERYLQSATGQ
jgi:phosphoesterase RecJ-like protein